MTWVKRLQIRQHWPMAGPTIILIAVVILFFFVRHQNVGIRYYRPRSDEMVDYWSLMSEFSDVRGLLLALFIISIVVTLAIFLLTSRQKPEPIVGLVLALVANMCSFLTCFGSMWICGAILEHKQSVTFEGHNYHYAFMTNSTDDCDAPSFTYVVHECDGSNTSCYARYVHPDNYVLLASLAQPASLILNPSNSTLHLQIGGETVYTVQATEAAIVEDNDA